MSLHSHSMHGRAIFGEEALQHLALRKRDFYSDNIKLTVPEGFPVPARRQVVVDTVVSNVFVTLPQSFTGSADGFATVRESATSTSANAGRQTGQSSGSSGSQRSSASNASRTGTETFNPATTHGAPIVTATSSLSRPYGSDSTTSNSADAANASSSNSASSSSSSQDIGSVAKIGIAVGAIVALAALAGLLFFCMRRKKNANAEKNGHKEKYDSMFGAQQQVPEALGTPHNSNRSTSPAPQLSLRPVTQFLPNLNEKRKSGDLLSAIAGHNQQRSAWDRKQGPEENPFADSAIREKSRPSTPNANPFDENQSKTSNNNSTSPDRGLQRPAVSDNVRPNGPAAPPAAVVAMGPSGPNNVHRVQLDFKPSMDDELELRSGQLVRMLHEYDDGWALCVRMDRSQQGVCPRTCLSKLPVKPRQGPPPNGRPNGPPGPGPQGQGNPGNRGPPNGHPRMPPSANRRPDNAPPSNGNNMYPRPLTPNGNSEQVESPSGLRKPVPGQAF